MDPLLSRYRYRTELGGWYHEHLHSAWNEQVETLLALLREGDEVSQMVQVTGEEGVSLADFVTSLKATFIDAVYLQQDASGQSPGGRLNVEPKAATRDTVRMTRPEKRGAK